MTTPSPVSDGNTTLPTDHLGSFTFEVVQDARDNKPEIIIPIDVEFSWHCFTRTPDQSECVFTVTRGRESRCFCPERYKYSFRLPEIIRQLPDRLIRHTGRDNFISIEIIDEQGERLEYEIYFRLRKVAKKQPLKLFVESAYIRRDLSSRPKQRRKRIRFRVIAYNVKMGKPIRS